MDRVRATPTSEASMDLRIDAINNVHALRGGSRQELTSTYDKISNEIAILLGYIDYNNLRGVHGHRLAGADRLDHVFHLLTGPYALTVLKTLEAQRGVSIE